jgi:hypothetical protein
MGDIAPSLRGRAIGPLCAAHTGPLPNPLPGVSPAFLRYAPCRPGDPPPPATGPPLRPLRAVTRSPPQFAAGDGRNRSQHRRPRLFRGLGRDLEERCTSREQYRSRAAFGIMAEALTGNHRQDHSPDRDRAHSLGPALGKQHKPLPPAQCHRAEHL